MDIPLSPEVHFWKCMLHLRWHTWSPPCEGRTADHLGHNDANGLAFGPASNQAGKVGSPRQA